MTQPITSRVEGLVRDVFEPVCTLQVRTQAHFGGERTVLTVMIDHLVFPQVPEVYRVPPDAPDELRGAVPRDTRLSQTDEEATSKTALLNKK